MVLSGSFLLGFVAVYAVFVLTPLGQLVDASALGAFAWARDAGALMLFESRELLVVPPIAAVGVALVTAPKRARVPEAAVGLVALVVVFALATLLKRGILARPDLGDFAYPENTFPSGHTAVALCAAVVLSWLVPPRAVKAVMIAGGGFAVAVSVFSVASLSHRASDVIGGALLVGAVAAILTRRLPGDSRRRRGLARRLVVMAAAGAAAFGVAAGMLAQAADASGPLMMALLLSSCAAVGAVLLALAPVGTDVSAPARAAPSP